MIFCARKASSYIIAELLILGGWSEFVDSFGLDELEQEQGERGKRKLLSIEEQYKLSKREFSRYAQETSNERYTRSIIFDDLDLENPRVRHDVVEDWLSLMPKTVWEKLTSHFRRKRETGWIATG